MTKDQIRAIFMKHGFTIKEGQTDLKQYVYDAAEELLALSVPPVAQDAPSERKAAEHAYITTAFDYASAPVGSRDWGLFFDGWRARASQPATPAQDTQRCIDARNKLNAALHGEGAVIDSLEDAVDAVVRRLSTPAQGATIQALIEAVNDILPDLRDSAEDHQIARLTSALEAARASIVTVPDDRWARSKFGTQNYPVGTRFVKVKDGYVSLKEGEEPPEGAEVWVSRGITNV